MATIFGRRIGRADILFLVLSLGYLAVAGRLFQVQVLRRAEYRDLAEDYHVRPIKIPAHRGRILDRNGEPLAINQDAGAASLDPSFYWDTKKFPVDRSSGKKVPIAPDKDKAARGIADVLDLDYDSVRKKLDSRKRFLWLKRPITLEVARRADAAAIPGLQIDYEPRRTYPMGSLAAHVLGFTNVDGKGIAGVEQRMQDVMASVDGVEEQEVDRLGRIIPGTLRSNRDPVDGADVVLTIDSRIQQVAERELTKSCEMYKAIGGTCTVLDPRTGEILAMASYPRFDPNQRGKYTADQQRNRPVTDLYEPGSTMKGVSAAAAVDAGAVSLNDRFNCPAALRIGSHVVHDVTHGRGAYGNQDLAGILAHSSNVGMSQVGLRLGARSLRDYVESFGLLDKSGVNLPGEADSWLEPARKWDRHFTATVAFGQSISFTALQLTSAYGVIANNGSLMKPQIVKRIKWPSNSATPGKVEDIRPEKVRQVIRPETARIMARLLGGVVSDGTGKPAKIRGYQLVGKTGSAQKAFPGRGYVSGKYIASFIGFLPKDNPRAVILVTVDEPKGTHWGATAAAPVFREVARQTMWYLDVPPDDPNDKVDGSEPRTWHNARRVARRR